MKGVLQHSNISKACCPDLLSPRLLKDGASILAFPYCVAFNHSPEQGYFPSCWKDANATPIYKKDDKSLPNNYRPISLLSLVGKVMERCLHKHLYNYIVAYQILTPLQSGFEQGYSTTYQLLHTYHTFYEADDRVIETKKYVLSSATLARHLTEYKGLLHKFWGIGCSEKKI